METSLILISLMSPNEDFIFDAIAYYLRLKTGYAIEVINKHDWREKEAQINLYEFDIAWICGLPYVRMADQVEPGIELLAAPVISGDRYNNRPIYFSDIVVRSDSRFNTFKDLRGASWAYNDPNSHSGYGVVKYFMAIQNVTGQFFGRVTESGSHLQSLAMILSGEIDASAIDSIVLGIELERRPELKQQLKIIGTIGPSPIPPLVISTRVPEERRVHIRNLLTGMNTNSAGRIALRNGSLNRLMKVTDAEYNTIREMLQKGKDIIL